MRALLPRTASELPIRSWRVPGRPRAPFRRPQISQRTKRAPFWPVGGPIRGNPRICLRALLPRTASELPIRPRRAPGRPRAPFRRSQISQRRKGIPFWPVGRSIRARGLRFAIGNLTISQNGASLASRWPYKRKSPDLLARTSSPDGFGAPYTSPARPGPSPGSVSAIANLTEEKRDPFLASRRLYKRKIPDRLCGNPPGPESKAALSSRGGPGPPPGSVRGHANLTEYKKEPFLASRPFYKSPRAPFCDRKSHNLPKRGQFGQ